MAGMMQSGFPGGVYFPADMDRSARRRAIPANKLETLTCAQQDELLTRLQIPDEFDHSITYACLNGQMLDRVLAERRGELGIDPLGDLGV